MTRLSLRIEPPADGSQSGPSLARSKDDMSNLPYPPSPDLPTTMCTPGGSIFVPRHRKTKSLGAK